MLLNWVSKPKWSAQGVSAATLSSISFAIMGILVRYNPFSYEHGSLVFWRTFPAIILLLPMVIGNLPRTIQKSALPIWFRSFAGAISVMCYFWTLQRTSLPNASLLASSTPIFVLLMAFAFTGERLNAFEKIGVLAVIVGGICLGLSGSTSVSGRVLAIGTLGAVAAAIAFVSLRKASQNFSPNLIVFVFSMVTALISLCAGASPFEGLKVEHLPYLLALGSSGLLAQLLLTYSYKHLSTSIANAMGRLVLLWGAFLEFIVFKVVPNKFEYAAYALVFCGVLLIQKRPQSPSKGTRSPSQPPATTPDY